MTSSSLNKRSADNAAAIWTVLKSLRSATSSQICKRLPRDNQICARRVADYMSALASRGYAKGARNNSNAPFIWRLTNKPPPDDWTVEFPATRYGVGLRKGRDAPVAAGPCALSAAFGLVPILPPEGFGRVYRAPTDYEAEAEQRAA
jgi:hypothetical protein